MNLPFERYITLDALVYFALNLMNITGVERNSTYSSKMNVPKNCKKSEECLQIFNTVEALTYALVSMAF
jgi:hypothetical protein